MMDEREERRRGKRTENKGERRVEDMAWKREREEVQREDVGSYGDMSSRPLARLAIG